jgi:hypothetical protein
MRTLQELVGISNPLGLKGKTNQNSRTLWAQPIRMPLSVHLISIEIEQHSRVNG